MNILQRLKAAFQIIFNKSSTSAAMNDLYKLLGIDPSNTEADALSEATYYACIKLLSEAMGKLPLKLLRYNEKNGVETMRKHPLYGVLHERPNPYMTASVFWSAVEQNRNHYGNAYVWVQGAGENTRLWLLPSNEVEVYYDNARVLADQPDIYYKYSCGGQQYVFGSEEILHFKTSNSFDGVLGISVRDQLDSTITGSIKAQKMLNKMYESGFTAKAVLQYTGSLSDENVQTLVSGIESYAKGELKETGVENTIPIPLGFQLTPLNVKLADNQFIEVKQYTSSQIAAAFGIKPYQYNDLTKSSYASAEAQQLSFYVDALLYIIKQYEEELNYKLLTAEERAQGYHFKFNVAAILRADFATQVDTLVKAVAGTLYTPNEARAYIDLEAREGGDRLLANGASIPVELTGAQYIKDLEAARGSGGSSNTEKPEEGGNGNG